MGFSTDAIHAGQEPDPINGAVIPPIYQTSTYEQEGLGKPRLGYEYARTQNPTRGALERNLATLESGQYAVAFGSGMAAIGCILQSLKSGDHVIFTDNLYGGTYRLADQVWRKFGLQFSFVDTSQLDAVKKAFLPNTKLLFLETPTNPVLTVSDIKQLSADISRLQ